MGRHTGYHAGDGRLSQNRQFPVRQHPRVHPAQGGKAQKALLVAGNDKADLIQVGIQEQPGRILLSAAAHSHYAAHLVNLHLVHDRPQQLCRGLCHGALKPAGCANGAQTGQCLFVIQGVPPYSWLTSSLNFLPRSIKFLKWSKAAQAGDSTTTSPALALSRASPTAAARSSAITISMPLFG